MKIFTMILMLFIPVYVNAGALTFIAATDAADKAGQAARAMKSNTQGYTAGKNSVMCNYNSTRSACSTGFDIYKPQEYVDKYAGHKVKITSITYMYLGSQVAIIEYEDE